MKRFSFYGLVKGQVISFTGAFKPLKALRVDSKFIDKEVSPR
jgi:hypothetical protein